MVVLQTADRFRDMVSALQSLDGSRGVSFHTFCFPADRCVRQVIKRLMNSLGRRPGGTGGFGSSCPVSLTAPLRSP